MCLELPVNDINEWDSNESRITYLRMLTTNQWESSVNACARTFIARSNDELNMFDYITKHKDKDNKTKG